MGLDTSHDCWHGAYSAFSRWREKIAEAAGYKIDDSLGVLKILLKWDDMEAKNFYGEWHEAPTDPLVYLLAHSDCEGVIKPEICGPLADALEKLLPKLDKEEGGHIGNCRDKTQEFIQGLREAAKNGERVEFH